MTTSIQEVLARQSSHAEKMRNDDKRAFTDADFAIGTVLAQGDLYIVAIDGLPKSAKPRKSRQMAEGETQGSRHILVTGDAYDADAKEVARMIHKATGIRVEEQYIGPVFETDGGCALLEHPEHGDHEYAGRHVGAIVFQRALDAEERAQRVRD